MDDTIENRRKVEEAIQTVKELSQLLPKAGMTPRKMDVPKYIRKSEALVREMKAVSADAKH